MKTVLNSFTTVILFVVLSAFNGCSDDTNPVAPTGPNVDGLVFIGESYAIGGQARVLMYADDTLKTGYNKIYLVLYDSITGTLITDSHIEFAPANHGVTAPVENPESNAVDGLFSGAVVFTDPSTDNNRHWHFDIHVHNHQAPGEPDGEAEFSGFTIRDNPDGFFKFQPDSTTSFTFALINPIEASMGLNDIEFLVSEQIGAVYEPFPWFTFDSMAVSLGPVVSTGNTNPSTIGNGHYTGRVNLTEHGYWNLFMRFKHHSGSGPTYSANVFRIHVQ